MMSHCAICRTPTDLALSDVLTDEQMKQFGSTDKVPLIGTCGDRRCVEEEIGKFKRFRLKHGQTTTPGSEPGTVDITGVCTILQRSYTIKNVPVSGLVAWYRGSLIQNALPKLSRGDAEFIISGTSPDGWKKLFPKKGGD
jgi:hypothetical protein